MSRSGSYVPNYFSIPDILASQDKVPVKFEVRIKELGMLEQGSHIEHADRGATMELPFWMASGLYKTPVNTASIVIPSTYTEGQRDILKADECVVNFHKQYFYEMGISICKLPIRESAEISEMLVQAFRGRFRLIMDWAMHAIIDVPGVRRLDQSEERIYYAAKEAALRLSHWLAVGDDLIEAGDLVVSHRKRQSGMLAINLEI